MPATEYRRSNHKPNRPAQADHGTWPSASGVIHIATLWQIIYSSQPFGYDEATLSGILLDARRCNLRDDVTGALVCRQDIYLQLLEGPEKSVMDTYARIARDDRHLEIRSHVSRPVSSRMFGNWAMLHDPARSWLWTQSEIAQGAIDNASPEDFQKLFEDLSDKVAGDIRE